jgi:hypothetical protein
LAGDRLQVMGQIENRLEDLGLTLPVPIVPPGNYQLVKVHAGLAYIAGHGPFDGQTPLAQGVVGRDLTLEEGYQAARITALSMLASLKRELGELDRVTDWLPRQLLRRTDSPFPAFHTVPKRVASLGLAAAVSAPSTTVIARPAMLTRSPCSSTPTSPDLGEA